MRGGVNWRTVTATILVIAGLKYTINRFFPGAAEIEKML
jgi:hypothetical protein